MDVETHPSPGESGPDSSEDRLLAEVSSTGSETPLDWRSPHDHIASGISAVISAAIMLAINASGEEHTVKDALPESGKQLLFTYLTSFIFGRICAYYAMEKRERLKAVLYPSLLNTTLAFGVHSLDFLGKTNHPLASTAYIFLGSLAGFGTWAEMKRSGKLEEIFQNLRQKLKQTLLLSDRKERG